MQIEVRPREKCELRFRSSGNPALSANDHKLICPQCGELLTRADVEVFYSCPYCTYRFEPSAELEDFILEPEIDGWIRRQPGLTVQFLLPLENRN